MADGDDGGSEPPRWGPPRVEDKGWCAWLNVPSTTGDRDIDDQQLKLAVGQLVAQALRSGALLQTYTVPNLRDASGTDLGTWVVTVELR